MTKDKAFDLASIDTVEACNKPAEIEIRHPVTGEPTGVFISVLGKDSDVWRGIVKGVAQEALKRRARGKAIDTDLDKADDIDIDALAKVTTGWRTGDDPTLLLKGEKLEFSHANARKVYAGILAVRAQVTEAINNLENFMPA
jgi:hypothetical protein